MRRAALALLFAAGFPFFLLAQEPAAPPLQETPAVRVLRTGGLRVETAALLMSGQQGGTIPFAALAIPLPGSAERARVPVVLELDGSAVLEGHPHDLLRLEISLYALLSPPAREPTGVPLGAAFGVGALAGSSRAERAPEPEPAGAGRVAGFRMDTIEIDLARLGEQVGRSGIKYVGELDLLPGEYTLRALVRNTQTSELGLRSLPLAVPDFAKAGRLLLPPLVSDAKRNAWLVVRGPSRAPLPAPLALEDLPSARPILAPDRETALRLPAWKVKEGELRVEVRRPGGSKVADFPLRVGGRDALGDGLEVLTAAFEPRGLEVDAYELRVTPGEVSYSTPFVLLQDGGGGEVWAALTAPRRPAGAPPAGEAGARAAANPGSRTPRKKKVRLDAGPVKASYRQALSRLAGGDGAGARAAVLELETSLLTGPRPVDVEDLADAQLAVARELSRGSAGSLLPILRLHLEVYRELSGQQRYLVSTHERELLFRLVDLYAERAAPETRPLAARALLGLAAELVRAAAPPGLRERTFRQVLAYEAGSELALLCLAVDAERQGRYPQALELLERLVRQTPANAEARLRLAVNRARLGKVEEGRKLLREIADGAGEAWLVSLAHHETARLLVAAGQLDEAERVLRQGLERVPRDEKLSLQLALVFDLRKQPGSAREVLARWQPGTAAPDTAEARNRYNRLPVERLDGVWSDFQSDSDGQLATLAAALGVPAQAAGPPRSTP